MNRWYQQWWTLLWWEWHLNIWSRGEIGTILNGNALISNTISLKFIPIGPINNIPVLFKITAWYLLDLRPFYETMVMIWMTHMSATGLQVNARLLMIQISLSVMLAMHDKTKVGVSRVSNIPVHQEIRQQKYQYIKYQYKYHSLKSYIWDAVTHQNDCMPCNYILYVVIIILPPTDNTIFTSPN